MPRATPSGTGQGTVINMSEPHRTSRRRLTFCAAITRHVIGSDDPQLKADLAAVLTVSGYEQRSLMELEALARDVGLHPDRIAEINEVEHVLYEDEPRYRCGVCADQGHVEMDDAPGRYERCPNCNPQEEDL